MSKIENCTLVLMHALGWQGGTVHQVSQATGLDVQTILNLDEHTPVKSTDPEALLDVTDYDVGFMFGYSSGASDLQYYKGNKDYWCGVLHCQHGLETDKRATA